MHGHGQMHDPYPLSGLVGKIALYTGDRGLTIIGRVAFAGPSDDLGSPKLVFEPGSYVVRRWGTTKGIGQLVAGPTSDTILDKYPYGPVTLTLVGAVSYHPVSQKGWADKFSEDDPENKEGWDDLPA